MTRRLLRQKLRWSDKELVVRRLRVRVSLAQGTVKRPWAGGSIGDGIRKECRSQIKL